jgi:hypothetical protein
MIFSPTGACLGWAGFWKIKEVAQFCGYFFRGESIEPILAKMGWAIFWAIFFTQTHLVTLTYL